MTYNDVLTDTILLECFALAKYASDLRIAQGNVKRWTKNKMYHTIKIIKDLMKRIDRELDGLPQKDDIRSYIIEELKYCARVPTATDRLRGFLEGYNMSTGHNLYYAEDNTVRDRGSKAVITAEG